MALISALPIAANILGGLFGGGRGGSSGTPEQSLGRETAQRILADLEKRTTPERVDITTPAIGLATLLSQTGGGGQILSALRERRGGNVAASQAVASQVAQSIFPSLINEFLRERQLQQQAKIAERTIASQELARRQAQATSLIASLLGVPAPSGGGGTGDLFKAIGSIGGLLTGGKKTPSVRGGVRTIKIAEGISPTIRGGSAGAR